MTGARCDAALSSANGPDALLPTLGGQTALNLALELQRDGVLAAVRRGADRGPREAIHKAEDRELFKKAHAARSASTCRSPASRAAWRRRGRSQAQHRLPGRSCGRRSRWAAGRRHRLQPRGVRVDAAGPRASPARRDAGRAIGPRLEGIRARGDARHARTTPSSSARSRTSIRWASTPATRSPWRRRMTLTDKEYQRMRDAALAVHPRDRRRDRRIQHPVRDQPRRRAA